MDKNEALNAQDLDLDPGIVRAIRLVTWRILEDKPLSSGASSSFRET